MGGHARLRPGRGSEVKIDGGRGPLLQPVPGGILSLFDVQLHLLERRVLHDLAHFGRAFVLSSPQVRLAPENGFVDAVGQRYPRGGAHHELDPADEDGGGNGELLQSCHGEPERY